MGGRWGGWGRGIKLMWIVRAMEGGKLMWIVAYHGGRVGWRWVGGEGGGGGGAGALSLCG